MIGPRLPAMLEAAGLEGVSEKVVANPMTQGEEKLFLAGVVFHQAEMHQVLGAPAGVSGQYRG